MTLITASDLDDVWLARIELYEQCAEATDREAFLSDTFSRIVTYLESGEQFSRINIRYEDPPNVSYLSAARQAFRDAHQRLEEMVGLITRREMEEEYEYGA